jgi:hypothetical protein
VQDAAGTEFLLEPRILRIVFVFRVLLGIEVIEIAEELVEPVHRRQETVLVAEMVLAELAGGVAERLQELGDRRILRLQAHRRTRDADLGEAGAEDALPSEEGCTARGAGLLAVRVGEPHPFIGDAVDVGRAIAHHPAAVATQVPDADIVTPDDEDVRLVDLLRLLRHALSPLR